MGGYRKKLNNQPGSLHRYQREFQKLERYAPRDSAVRALIHQIVKDRLRSREVA